MTDPHSRSTSTALSVEMIDMIQRGTMAYRWKGVLCLKNPFDIALYQMLLWETKPATLIEIGSNEGGSAYWFADILEIMGLKTRIISIDVKKPETFRDPRIDFRQGDGLRLEKTLSHEEMASLARPLLVIEDASHDYEVSLATLRFFDRWLKAGEYHCVEDGIIESFGVQERYNGGPTRAIAEFMSERGDDYVIDDKYCDYFGRNVTWNINGFLRKLRDPVDHIAKTAKADETRYGDKRASISHIELSDSSGRTTTTLKPRQEYTLTLRIDPVEDIAEVVVGFIIRTARGGEVYGVDSLQTTPAASSPLKAGRPIEFVAKFRNVLTAGDYFATVALAEPDTTKLDVRFDVLRFTAEGPVDSQSAPVVDVESSTRYERL